MSTVCLFDIDGTLLNSGGAGQYAMEMALLDVFGVTGPYEDIPAAGRTDKAITTDLFNHHRIETSSENWDRFLSAYLQRLPEALSTHDGRVLPGIVEMLDLLANHDGIELGLLTGNFKVAANLKLNHYGIDHHFAFGGFGDTEPNRDDVARAALQEACRHLDRNVPGESVWVIGDTPSDVTCGRAIGARTIAVATGIFDSGVLRSTNPDFLFEDFSDVATVIECLAARV